MSTHQPVVFPPHDPLGAIYARVPPAGRVLDVGCLGYRQYSLANALGRRDLRHYGTDVALADATPPDFCFRPADLDEEGIPFEDGLFDLVVASHVLEHLRRPVQVFGDIARVCAPGGLLYVEAPSERSLWLPGMPFAHEGFFSLSFFDDPTHTSRPWTPQSLYRLACYYQLAPLGVGYRYTRRARILFPWYLVRALATRNGRLLESALWNAVGWASFAVLRRPADSTRQPEFRYYVPAR